ncbi:MAG TPA: hypothetical protein VGC91_09235 [Pyrinomonadaceae bacterium]
MDPIFPRQIFSTRRQTILGATLSLSFLLLVLILAPASAQAQSVTVYGALSNFDVVNSTEHEAHGFEIELEGLQVADVAYWFSVERYGSPTIVPSATGVYVRWTSGYDAAAQQFLQTTVAHVANTPFAGTCYQWGGASYETSGCEHFGVTLRATPIRTTYRWLIEDAQTPGTLTPVDPPVALPAPYYLVPPPVQAGNPPVLVAEIEAPEPPETPETFGNAQWVKVFKTELPREVTLEELLGDNPIVPRDAAQTEVAWEILQASPPSHSNGNGGRNRRQNQGSLSANTRAVIRRYEVYQYTGAYDPLTHEVVCADGGLCNAPQDGELGDYVGAQMAAANVGVPSVTVTKTGGGSVSSSDRLISCGNKCSASYNLGTSVTLTASPSSGNVFTGWGGACSGNQLTCTVNVNEVLNVSATFAPVFNFSVKSVGKGTVTGNPSLTCGGGGSCSNKFAQGTVVTLTAVPAAGSQFTNWTGACTGTSRTCTLTVTKDTSVQANFSK